MRIRKRIKSRKGLARRTAYVLRPFGTEEKMSVILFAPAVETAGFAPEPLRGEVGLIVAS
jgi:hypothetical protein